MNSLPLISHHLFVSAIGHESAKSGSRVDHAARGPAQAKVVPLELLENDKPLPAGVSRALRTAISRTSRSAP